MRKKVIFVTGASSGFGCEVVKILSTKGHIVYGAARRIEKMEVLKNYGAAVIKMDVTQSEQVNEAVAHIIEAQGKIDVLVNCAGYGVYGMVENVSIKAAQAQFDVNVFGYARVFQAVLPYMRKRRSGTIINISSVGGKIALPMSGWYAASKHAIEGLSDSMRSEVKSFGINVTLIEPGAIQTGFSETAMHIDVAGHDPDYHKNAEAFIKSMTRIYAKSKGPESVAAVIVKVCEKAHPKPRYLLGSDSKLMIFMKTLLPTRAFDNLLCKALGIQ